MVDYLTADIIEQFKGKPNIQAVLSAFERQLQEVYDFYDDLRDLRTVSASIGKQLDGIGDIVELTRADAGSLSAIANPGQILDDEVYRTFLYYKIWKNTNTCTYPDIIKSFQMFWDKELYYSESPNEPATMILSSGILKPEDNSYKLLTAPIIKAAGVKLIVRTITVADVSHLTVTPSGHYATCSSTVLPEILPEHEFDSVVTTAGLNTSIAELTLPQIIPSHDFEEDVTLAGLITSTVSSSITEHLPVHEFEQELVPKGMTAGITETVIPEAVPDHEFVETKELQTVTTGIAETSLGEVAQVVNLTAEKSISTIVGEVRETTLQEAVPVHDFQAETTTSYVTLTTVECKIPDCEQIAFDFGTVATTQTSTHNIVSTQLEEKKED